MKIRILFVISLLKYGGAQKILSFLANNLSSKGYEVYIYTFAGNTIDYKLNKEVIVLYEDKVHKNILVKKFAPFFKTRRIIKQINPDVVISFLTNANFLSIICTLFTKIPVIISERSDPYYEKNIMLSFMRLFYRFADGAVFQTTGARNYYSEKIRKISTVIPNPVIGEYENSLLPFSKRKNEIAFVARFDIKQKRQDVIVKAFKKVVEKYKEMKLVFYGDGPDLEKIMRMVERYNLSNNVIFKGKIDNVNCAIKDAKLFVLTSDYEGIPNALIEAMSIGLPVISTDCSPGGARSLIEHKKNGLLVPRGDIDELANSIIYLLDNPDIAEMLGKEAKKIIETLDSNKILDLWEDYLKKILKKVTKKQTTT